MKKYIVSIITIITFTSLLVPLTSLAEDALWLYFAVDREDNVSLDSFNVLPEEYGGIFSEPISSDNPNAFEARILDSGGNILNRAYFIPDFLILSDPPIEVDETVDEVVFPYSQNTSTVQVLKGGEIILSESIGIQLCNRDGICNNKENYISCSQDCDRFSEDDYCNSISNDHICDPDCLWDSEAGGECSQPNCNDGIRNQDETSIDSGGICLKLKCENGIQDPGEEGIDCGGICSQWWQCAEDTCGDGICAEYENRTSCPIDCGAPLSILKNTGAKPLVGYLLIKVQKLVGVRWSDEQAVIQDASVRTIQPSEVIDLRNIWNSQNYIAKEEGKFRVYVGFLDQNQKTLASDTYEFAVLSSQKSALEPTSTSGLTPAPSKDKTIIEMLKQQIITIQQKIAQLLNKLAQLFK